MVELGQIKSDEGPAATRLILLLFERFIFADYTEEGRAVVREYVTPASLVADDTENFAFVARANRSIVGIAKVKRYNHLSMLFVSAQWQGHGYGRRLVEAAVAECRRRNPDVSAMTVNSSKFALSFFQRRGFRAVDQEQAVHGVRFTPMRLEFPT